LKSKAFRFHGRFFVLKKKDRRKACLFIYFKNYFAAGADALAESTAGAVAALGASAGAASAFAGSAFGVSVFGASAFTGSA
jgi:hypothetical protein